MEYWDDIEEAKNKSEIKDQYWRLELRINNNYGYLKEEGFYDKYIKNYKKSELEKPTHSSNYTERKKNINDYEYYANQIYDRQYDLDKFIYFKEWRYLDFLYPTPNRVVEYIENLEFFVRQAKTEAEFWKPDDFIEGKTKLSNNRRIKKYKADQLEAKEEIVTGDLKEVKARIQQLTDHIFDKNGMEKDYAYETEKDRKAQLKELKELRILREKLTYDVTGKNNVSSNNNFKENIQEKMGVGCLVIIVFLFTAPFLGLCAEAILDSDWEFRSPSRGAGGETPLD